MPWPTRAFSTAVGSEVKNGVTEVRLGVVVRTFPQYVVVYRQIVDDTMKPTDMRHDCMHFLNTCSLRVAFMNFTTLVDVWPREIGKSMIMAFSRFYLEFFSSIRSSSSWILYNLFVHQRGRRIQNYKDKN